MAWLVTINPVKRKDKIPQTPKQNAQYWHNILKYVFFFISDCSRYRIVFSRFRRQSLHHLKDQKTLPLLQQKRPTRHQGKQHEIVKKMTICVPHLNDVFPRAEREKMTIKMSIFNVIINAKYFKMSLSLSRGISFMHVENLSNCCQYDLESNKMATM